MLVHGPRVLLAVGSDHRDGSERLDLSSNREQSLPEDAVAIGADRISARWSFDDRDSGSAVNFCSDIQQPLCNPNGRWLRISNCGTGR